MEETHLLIPLDSILRHSLPTDVPEELLGNDREDVLESLSPGCLVNAGLLGRCGHGSLRYYRCIEREERSKRCSF
jgi:hypothetical protein